MKSERLQRNRVALQIAESSPVAFRTIVRSASKDILTLICALAIGFATQQIKSAHLLPHLRKHKRFVHRVGNERHSAEKLRTLLLQNRNSFYILKPLLAHTLDSKNNVS